MTKFANIFGFVAAAALAHAQTSTVSLFLLDTDQQSLVASVVAAQPSATTLAVNCPEGTDSDDCGVDGEWVTMGKDFFAMNVTEGDFTATWSCDVAGTTSASCSESNGGAEANFPGTSTTVLSPSEITYFPVVITAGAEKLQAQPGASATGSGAASSSASSTGASASITTAPLLFPQVNPSLLVASLVSVSASTTVYKIDCKTDVNESPADAIECPFGPDIAEGQVEPWLTMAPNFFGMNFTADRDDGLTLSCSVSSTSLASCVQQMSGTLEGSTVTSTISGTTRTLVVPGSATTSTTTSDVKLFYGTITVTAGVEKFAQATTSSSSGSASSSGASKSGGSSSSTGAAPRETGLGLLAMAAAAGAGLLI